MVPTYLKFQQNTVKFIFAFSKLQRRSYKQTIEQIVKVQRTGNRKYTWQGIWGYRYTAGETTGRCVIRIGALRLCTPTFIKYNLAKAPGL